MDDHDTIALWQDDDLEWRWTRRSANGEVVAASTESYVSRRDAVSNLLRINDNAVCSATDENFYHVPLV